MWIEWLKDIFDTIKKVTDSVKKFNEKDTNFLQAPSTQSFIQYLNATYKPEQIQQELWCSIENYIENKHHNLFQNKIKKWAEFFEDITWIVSGTKIETTQLKEEIVNNENIWMLQAGIQMVSWEQSPIKTSIDNFLWATTETDKNKILQSLWIPTAPQKNAKQKNTEIEKTDHAIETKKNVEINIKKIKEGIFASESKHEKKPYKANNPKSSAIGKYQFLWNSRKDKIENITNIKTEEEYINNPEKQELFMDYVIENIYLTKAQEYQKEYPSWQIPEIIMLIHFKGEKGALDWIKNKEDKTMANNISIEKYINNFQKEYYV